jgi:phosphosulfolactate synthase (CoM biosynthesis protein A)
METIKNAANAVTNKVSEIGHHAEAESAKNRAADPNRSVTERVEAGGHAISEKAKETVSGVKSDHYKEQAKHA